MFLSNILILENVLAKEVAQIINKKKK